VPVRSPPIAPDSSPGPLKRNEKENIGKIRVRVNMGDDHTSKESRSFVR